MSDLPATADPSPNRRRRAWRVLFMFACLVTLIALLYTEENWRGRRVWDHCRKQLEARGVNMDWSAHIPQPVPDEQNLFKAPGIAEWFVKPSQGSASNELSYKCSMIAGCVGRQQSNPVAEVSLVGLNNVPSGQADITIWYTNSASPGLDAAQKEKLRHIVQSALWPTPAGENGPTLQGAQDYTLLAKPPEASRPPVRVMVSTDKALAAKEVGELFPGGGNLRVESKNPGRFEVFLHSPKVFAAADYLMCSDQLRPEFDRIRNALKRPYARREGDYQHTWQIPIQNFVTIRTVAQTLSQRAQCDLLLGNPEAALAELTLLHDLSRLSAGKPMTLVAAMINVALSGLYTSVIADGLRLHALREPQLSALQQQLQDIQLLQPLVEAMEIERVSACHLFETTSRAELVDMFGPDNQSVWSKLQEPRFWGLHCMPQGWFYQNMAALAMREQAFIETINLTRNIIEPEKADGVGYEAIAWVNRVSPFAVLARVAMPNYLKATQTVAQKQTLASQALLACALERYWLAHNDYPESLATMVPELVTMMPHDVITGEEFKYRRVDSRHFLLYSVGWNRTDDGGHTGKSATDGDWVWEAKL